MSSNSNLPEQTENQESGELVRQSMEIRAIEGYRSGNLSDREVARILGFSISETDEFLRKHGLFAFENSEEREKENMAVREA